MTQKPIKYSVFLRNESVVEALRNAKLLYPWENLVNISRTDRGTVVVTAERNK
jgi:hypothetical protein